MQASAATAYEGKMQQALNAYVPEHYGFAAPKVTKVEVDKAKRTVTVVCNESTAYVNLSPDQAAALVADCKSRLPKEFAKYKVNVVVRSRGGDQAIQDLALYAGDRKAVGPTETVAFITDLQAQPAPDGLDGSNIAMWQSHGWYFEPKLNRWEWQRARIFQTVEDLYTQSYVMPFLMPMLENAGAYVMSPRERDVQTVEYILDNDGTGYRDHNGSKHWSTTKTPGFANDGSPLTVGVNPFRQGTARQVETVAKDKKASTASYTANIAKDGQYAVYVSYQSLPNSTTDALYTVHTAAGDRQFTVNQKMGGGTWIYLGHFPFRAGEQQIVSVTNASSTPGAILTADAVKVGGGIGNVARIVKEPLDSIDYEYVLSGYPRFTEGAKYWLQWAGAPDSVYTPSDNVNDYSDDYRSRGLWVNWLTGGSSMLPEREGLNIPVDLAFAFHTDAGTTRNDSIIGTLGIYFSKANDGVYANGTNRLASRDLTDLVMSNIVRDVRAQYEPNWTRRGMWDQSYYEARVPEVPTMLLELLSHQNFADMKYGLDPEFRFTVSRAIYKAMGQFLAHRDGRQFVAQPLAPRAFAISRPAAGQYKLTWKEHVDTLEATATPTYYIIEECVGDLANGFHKLAQVSAPEYTLTVSDDLIHSYRIIAGNTGGVSFPSETLSLCEMGDDPVLVVNGFTRVSAPDWIDGDQIAGFYDVRDHGVPYLQDISYIGTQFEFRRDIPWMDDDAAGFGASRANYEKDVIAGNTFNYPYVHGQAIRAAGRGFYSASVEAFSADPVQNMPRIVDLILGKQKEVKTGRGAMPTRFKAFPTELQNKLARYTAGGGNLFISGAYVATDIWDNPNSSKEVAEADQKFATEVLGYHWRVDQASVTGEAYTVKSRFREFTPAEYQFSAELNSECYAVESPDSFYAANKDGATIMRYTENNLVAGIAYNPGSYRTVVIGFPFETIKSAAERDELMGQVLNFLSQPGRAR